MTMLSKYFSLKEMTVSETARRRGLRNEPKETEYQYSNLQKTCAYLDIIREHIGDPIAISSGLRMPEVNRAVGGAANSAHVHGSAADIGCPALTDIQLFKKIMELKDKIPFDQVILEYPERGAGAWVHVGFRHNSTPRGQFFVISKTNKNLSYWLNK